MIVLRRQARLAQSVEHETLNLRVVGSSPTLGANFSYFLYCFIPPKPNLRAKSKHFNTSHGGHNRYDMLRILQFPVTSQHVLSFSDQLRSPHLT